jgi:glycosyltransferase involved in cell wall biosynthesis
MPAHRPAVSVIVPVYNGEALLADAIGSIQRQTQPPDEIVIVDDGSSDGTATVAARLRGNLRYVHQPNGGPPATRNTGLRIATGDVIATLDADDLWPTDRMERLLGTLAADTTIEVALGRLQLICGAAGTDGERCERLSEPAPGLFLGSALFRRSAFERVGLFDPALRLGDDLDWFLRAMEARLPMTAIEPVTLLYRMHTGNTTHDRAAVQHGIATALHKSLRRRRDAGGGQVAPLPAIPGCGSIDDALRRTVELQRRAWAGAQP